MSGFFGRQRPDAGHRRVSAKSREGAATVAVPHLELAEPIACAESQTGGATAMARVSVSGSFLTRSQDA